MTVGELKEELRKMPQSEEVIITDNEYMLGVSGIRPGDDFKSIVLFGNYEDTHNLTVSELLEALAEKEESRAVLVFDNDTNYYTPEQVKLIEWKSMPELLGKVWII